MREVFTLTQDHNGRWAVAIGPERAMREHRRFSKAARASKENSRYQVIATVRPVRVLRFRKPDDYQPKPIKPPIDTTAKTQKNPEATKAMLKNVADQVAERMKKAREARAAKAKAAA